MSVTEVFLDGRALEDTVFVRSLENVDLAAEYESVNLLERNGKLGLREITNKDIYGVSRVVNRTA